MRYKQEVLRRFEHARHGQLVEIRMEDCKYPDVGWIEKVETDDMVEGYTVTIKPKEFGGFMVIPLSTIETWEVLPDLEKEPPQQLHLFTHEQLLLPL